MTDPNLFTCTTTSAGFTRRCASLPQWRLASPVAFGASTRLSLCLNRTIADLVLVRVDYPRPRLKLKRAVALTAACVLPTAILFWWGLYLYLGIWPLDIGSNREMLVATAQSSSGERFRIVQRRTWFPEGYYTDLEHISGNGHRHVEGLDADDFKIWEGECSLQVDEQKKKVVVYLPRHGPFKYYWERRSLERP